MPIRDQGALVVKLEDLREILGTWEAVAGRIWNSEEQKPVHVRTLYKWLAHEQHPDKHIIERVRRLHRYHVKGHK